MYLSYVSPENDSAYFLYFLHLVRYFILHKETEYDNLTINCGIPKEALDKFITGESMDITIKQPINHFNFGDKLTVFNESLQLIDDLIEEEDLSGKEKEDMLRQIIDIIYRDILSDYEACIFLNTKGRCFDLPPNLHHLDKENIIKNDKSIINYYQVLNLNENKFIIERESYSLKSFLGYIKSLFIPDLKYKEPVYDAYMFSVIDIGYLHIYSDIMGMKKSPLFGVLNSVEVIDTAVLYEYISTNGIFWETKTSLSDDGCLMAVAKDGCFMSDYTTIRTPIQDIRFPLIYEIGRRIYNDTKNVGS